MYCLVELSNCEMQAVIFWPSDSAAVEALNRRSVTRQKFENASW